MNHEVTREIGIDAGHRVTYHGSKCKNLHGHRYTIQVTCRGPLTTDGVSEGMVMDFGFLKELMMQGIDGPCDHGLILWAKDPLLRLLIDVAPSPGTLSGLPGDVWRRVADSIDRCGSWCGTGVCGKLYIVSFVPTAENLAHHWFELLQPEVKRLTHDQASLIRVRVWETPNSYADFACE